MIMRTIVAGFANSINSQYELCGVAHRKQRRDVGLAVVVGLALKLAQLPGWLPKEQIARAAQQG